MGENSNIVFEYTPDDWSERRFLECGGFVAVVLNYNKKGLIGRAAQSALEQDYPCYEVLMMDDCSTDGSREEMLDVAKVFAARHRRGPRVRVVFNATTRSIVGQWQQAVKLSGGSWFGMFCGDDVSYPKRMMIAKQLTDQYSTAWGICTNFFTNSGEVYLDGTGHLVWPSADTLLLPKESIYGCAAWWRREVFDYSMEASNLDDYELTMFTIARRYSDQSPALIWALDEKTVVWTRGTGITSSMSLNGVVAWNGILRSYFEQRHFFKKFGRPINVLIERYVDKYVKDGCAREYVTGLLLIRRMRFAGWIERMVVFLLVHCRRKDFGGLSKRVRHDVGREFFKRILGLVSYVSLCWAAKLRGRV